ncbi:hypothetical protein D3C80_1515050 [compost metagenome]
MRLGQVPGGFPAGLLERDYVHPAEGGRLVPAPSHHVAHVAGREHPDAQAWLLGVVHSVGLFLGRQGGQKLGGELGFHGAPDP